jgi:hypothetical protein
MHSIDPLLEFAGQYLLQKYISITHNELDFAFMCIVGNRTWLYRLSVMTLRECHVDRPFPDHMIW